MRRLAFALLAVFLTSCSGAADEGSFTFDEGPEGWSPGFADYPANANLSDYELVSDWRELPGELEGSALFSQGHNRSDDLFMYWTREFEGLEPTSTYEVSFRVVLASNVPEGMLGIGGSPGESVWIKAGAESIEPDVSADDQGWLRMTIDIGNQASGGSDALVIGTFANPNLDPGLADGLTYELMTLDSNGQTLAVTPDSSGTIWALVGADSGFEGLTAVYFSEIEVEFREIRS